jgi:hypothetical protein
MTMQGNECDVSGGRIGTVKLLETAGRSRPAVVPAAEPHD